MRYWRIGIGFETGEEKVDMVGTVLSTEMVRPRLMSISLFTIRMNEDMFKKGFSNSSITFDLLNHDGIYDNRFKGDESVWVELDGRIVYTGNVSLTPGDHPNIFKVIVDTDLLGLDEEVNLKIKAEDYSTVPAVSEGNFGGIYGGTFSDEDDDPSAGMIPCYKVATGKYLLAWHPCFALLGAYLVDGTDIKVDCALLNDEDDRAYITYTDTDPDMIRVNIDGMISPEITFTKDADADQTIRITLSLHAGRECVIHWGDTNETTVTGPVTEQDYDHTYPDANEYPIEIVRDVRHVGYFECGGEPISGDIDGFEALGQDAEVFILNNIDIDGGIDAIDHLIYLKNLYLKGTSVTGSLNSIENYVQLEFFNIGGLPLSGDASVLSSMTTLIYAIINNSSISGNLSSFSALVNLKRLWFHGTSVVGDISNLSALIAMEQLYGYSLGVNITGDISNLAAMVLLKTLLLYFTSVSGDIGSLAGLTSLTNMQFYSTSVTYSTTTLPGAWDNCTILIQDLGWIVNMVNVFLIDLDSASTASTKTLNISGTNAAPTGPGITAKNSLIAKGWTVTTS